jgi:hypothetical protein
MNPANLNPYVLSVRFRSGEVLNLNQTERTIREGSGSGSGIFPNRTELICGNTNMGMLTLHSY